MTPRETLKAQVTRVAEELTPALKEQARGRWSRVRMAERNVSGRHVWRFRAGPGEGERFLHIEHQAMAGGGNAAQSLLEELRTGRWLDLLHDSETAVLLSRDGRLTSLPAR
ncbi:MAG TPA: hypothetical protein VHG91_02580 [Longimicrobium sp.]|nr:hypothetical protein [Longimicrobium sp.]